jgi:hypothetical protein
LYNKEQWDLLNWVYPVTLIGPLYFLIIYYLWKQERMTQAKDLTEEIINKSMSDQIKAVDDKTKREYMERIWNMDKAQIFHELMRVHGESAKLLMMAEEELNRLKGIHQNEPLH